MHDVCNPSFSEVSRNIILELIAERKAECSWRHFRRAKASTTCETVFAVASVLRIVMLGNVMADEESAQLSSAVARVGLRAAFLDFSIGDLEWAVSEADLFVRLVKALATDSDCIGNGSIATLTLVRYLMAAHDGFPLARNEFRERKRRLEAANGLVNDLCQVADERRAKLDVIGALSCECFGAPLLEHFSLSESLCKLGTPCQGGELKQRTLCLQALAARWERVKKKEVEHSVIWKNLRKFDGVPIEYDRMTQLMESQKRKAFQVCETSPPSVEMAPKKVRKVITIQVKKEIIQKNEAGCRVIDLAQEYGVRHSTISTILAQKEKIMASSSAFKGVACVSGNRRASINEEMEKLLAIWINDRHLKGDITPTGIIMEKARDLSSADEEEEEGRQPIPTTVIKKFLKNWEELQEFVNKNHPEQAEVNRAGDIYSETAMRHFRQLLKKRQRQTTLDNFFQVSAFSKQQKIESSGSVDQLE
ncbi:unnamed protein product, partial [Notodromas monacha]